MLRENSPGPLDPAQHDCRGRDLSEPPCGGAGHRPCRRPTVRSGGRDRIQSSAAITAIGLRTFRQATPQPPAKEAQCLGAFCPGPPLSLLHLSTWSGRTRGRLSGLCGFSLLGVALTASPGLQGMPPRRAVFQSVAWAASLLHHGHLGSWHLVAVRAAAT